MKGQTQALTTVLITTVIVGAIAAGYTWGTPLLEKRESQASLNSVERDVLRLHSAATGVADSGQGSAREVDFRLDQGGVEVNEKENYIEVRAYAQDSPYPGEVWKLLRGQSMQNLSMGTGSYGVKGTDQKGVVAVKSSSGSENRIRYRVEFRNIRSDQTIESVDLVSKGASRSNGDVNVILRNTGFKIDNTYKANGQEFRRERTILEVDLQ